jgi:hypothetical protein
MEQRQAKKDFRKLMKKHKIIQVLDGEEPLEQIYDTTKPN